MTKKQHWAILSSAGLPIILGLFLVVINPRFMGHLVKPGPVQPFGWLMVIAVFILVGAAYVVQRKIMTWALAAEPSRQIVIRRAFFLVCSVLFLVLPAVLMVFFGPALITMVEKNL